MPGKCTRCEKPYDVARLEHLAVSDGKMTIKMFAANCPNCGVTQGVVVDPRPVIRALKTIEANTGATPPPKSAQK